MFELSDAAAPAAGDVIKDGSDATFMADVIEASREVPVIVDFWAPWCGPCKQMMPGLEAAVRAAKGKVKLVKIDVDQNQMVAGQLRVQSVPMVYAFFQGQPVDGFQGAQPPSELTKFVEKLAALGGADGLAEALAAAEDMLEQGEIADAIETFAAILGEEPENAGAFGGLARAQIAAGDLEAAEALLASAAPKLATTQEVEAAKAQLELAKQAANAGPEAELEAQVAAEPDNHQARFDLAIALNAGGKVEAAVEQLLELFRRDREWNEGAAKAQLFTIFDALKPQDPIVLKGRRRLSSMIYL